MSSGPTTSTSASQVGLFRGSPFFGPSRPLNWWKRIQRIGTSRATSYSAEPTPEPYTVLVAVDVEGDSIRIVTAYRPDVEDWLDDLKTRRPKQ